MRKDLKEFIIFMVAGVLVTATIMTPFFMLWKYIEKFYS
jgi:hypothetical protein